MSRIVTENWSLSRYTRDGVGRWTAQRGWNVSGVRTDREAVEAIPEAAHNAGFHLNDALKCDSAHSDHNDSFTMWTVTATYSEPENGEAHPGGDGGGGGGTDPLLLPPNFDELPVTASVQTERDAKGRALTNSAFDVFKGIPPKTFTEKNYRVILNMPAYDSVWAALFENTVNSATIRTPFGDVGPGEGLIDHIYPIEPVLPGARYARVEIVMAIKRRIHYPECPADRSPHDWCFIDQGFNGYWSDNGFLRKDRFFHWLRGEVQTDVLLNGKGAPIRNGWFKIGEARKDAAEGQTPPGASVVEVDGVIYLWYPKYSEADHNALPIFNF